MLRIIALLLLFHPLIGARVKVVKIVQEGRRVTNIIPSPIPATFRPPPNDFSNFEQPLFNLSEPLSPIVNKQLFEEISLVRKQHQTPKEYLTRRDESRRNFLKEEEENRKGTDKPWFLPKKVREEFTGKTKVEIRRAKKLAKKTNFEIPDIVTELLYYIYVEKKVRKRDFRAYDIRLYKILTGWEKKVGQEKFWIAMRSVVEYWLSRPPNSRTPTHYVWNNFPDKFPSYLDHPTPFSVLDEPMKLHPPPEEDLEGYLFSSISPAISRLTKEKLGPVFRTSSILLWHKSRREFERERESASAAAKKSDMFFITPSLPSGDKGQVGSRKRFLIDDDNEMFLPSRFAESETEFFTAL